MRSDHPERDRFVHALISPLTALQGAVSLLRRRLPEPHDQTLAALLAALERSAVRLRATADLLIGAATVNHDRILIELPFTGLPSHRAEPVETPQPIAPQPRSDQPADDAADQVVGEGQVLVIAALDGPGEPIAEELRRYGYQLNWATHSAQGLDLARTLRPTLVLIDPAVDGQGEVALRVLEEDPDTKGVVVAALAEGAHSAGMRALTVAPSLPPAEAAELLHRAVAPGQIGRDGRPHILIVDDEPDIAALIAMQFSGEGYQTTTVHSGAAALRLVREQQFGLILLDVMLPDIDGFATLGGLRAQPETQLTPIILVSAINSPAEKVRGLRLGADDYITKPFSAAELSARVQAAFRRSEREGGANPSTRLPGNLAIERSLSQRIAVGQPFAVCYGDLDNFKAYNDAYGFLKGDAVIQRTAQILLDAVRASGNPDDFVGHIGGDDFVIITTPERVAPVCEAAARQFDETAPLFYDPEARAHGFIDGLDRQGRPMRFPLVSITFAVVSSAKQFFSHPGEVAQRAVDAKKRAKLIPGSIFLLEE